MRQIKIAFYYGSDSIIDKAIQLKTSNFSKDWRTVASHVEISLDNNYFYSMDTQLPFPARKILISLDESRWRTYEFEVSDEEYIAMKSLAESLMGSGYDWSNIFFGDVLGINIGSGSRYTCDEIVAVILQQCWVGDGLKELNKLNPHSLEEYIKLVKPKG